jgi:hypothetical protein
MKRKKERRKEISNIELRVRVGNSEVCPKVRVFIFSTAGLKVIVLP